MTPICTKDDRDGGPLAIAVNCGLTKAFSFMLTSPATTHVFSNLGVGDDMHTTCHAGRWDDIRKIAQYQMEAFALFLDSFAKISCRRVRHCSIAPASTAQASTAKAGSTAKKHPLIPAGGSCRTTSARRSHPRTGRQLCAKRSYRAQGAGSAV